MREASRCLDCGVTPVFDGNRCILCGGCADVCPENCLQIVPLSQLHVPEETRARLVQEAEIHPPVLQHLGPADLPGAEGAVMLKDETICIRCGLCAERCPAHTITMEAFEVFDHDPEAQAAELVAT